MWVQARAPASAEELAEFETDVLSGVRARSGGAGLADGTIRSDVVHPGTGAGMVRNSRCGDWHLTHAYVGKVLRTAVKSTGLARAHGHR